MVTTTGLNTNLRLVASTGSGEAAGDFTRLFLVPGLWTGRHCRGASDEGI
jgi:hypothetical protein